MLTFADFTLPFILEVDASHGGLGTMLSQVQEGKVRPVAYASRGLRLAKHNTANYSFMKLEFLALKWAMTEKFREYLLGHKCIVYTGVTHSCLPSFYFELFSVDDTNYR